VENLGQLTDRIKTILGDDVLAEELGLRAYALIASNSGATGRNIQIIKGLKLL